ncbi:MAG: hypothetical protein R2911_26145 [Caldilineaceae bacterium]
MASMMPEPQMPTARSVGLSNSSRLRRRSAARPSGAYRSNGRCSFPAHR